MKKILLSVFILTIASFFAGCSHTRKIGLTDCVALDPEKVKVSCENKDKATVLTLLGAPSFTNEAESNWYYVGIEVKEALFDSKIESQKITQIQFSTEGIVKNINTYCSKPSKIKILATKTPTKIKNTHDIRHFLAPTSTKKKRQPKIKQVLNFY